MLIPGPPHPDLFGGETPTYVETGFPLRLWRVQVEIEFAGEIIVAAADLDEAEQLGRELKVTDFDEEYRRVSATEVEINHKTLRAVANEIDERDLRAVRAML